jgi:threonylcarbamoyladenosine tRNA methylthiotransferase MtaB
VADLPDVDFVVGLNRVPDLLRFVDRTEVSSGAVRVAVGEVKRERGVPVLGARALPGHTRAFLKIQEGCNYSCAYCIIPIARGLSRSVPPAEILREISGLAERGCVEVVRTGIHLGGYGHDLVPKIDLTTLLELILERSPVRRLRLSSLDPREVPERLLQLIAESEILCPHLHVCAQAGDDQILKQMRRNYDTVYYRDIVARARELLPEAALGSDIIVGFPGESETSFARQMEFFDSLPLTYFHVFPYSLRSTTAAAALPGQIPLAVKKARAGTMRELGTRKKREFYRRFLGRRVSVLVESDSNSAGALRGYSRNYLPVAVRGAARVNEEVEVAVEGLENGALVGRAVGC